MTTYETISLAFAGVSAVASLAAGVSAVFAVINLRRHWADDEPKLSCTYLFERLSLGKENAEAWTAVIRVVNVGKVPASVVGFEYLGRELAARRSELALDERIEPELVAPGVAVDVTARAFNIHGDVPPAHVDGVDVLTADGRRFRAVRLPGHCIDCYGHKRRYDG